MSAMPRYVPSASAQPARCHAVWHRSSYSTGMNNCVETALLGTELLAVRDSRRGAGPVLLFPRTTWSVFVTDLDGGRPARSPGEDADGA
ncbi:DUF397 domain-containing protein [Streptomyces hesseae]|uniref:DUF397 domain-containing protein n=1 Tax=Streptomyces hesseae TaxID=3075519 RepID=A0ABU2SRY5_9ACTN|nr:DUF397 domain-containing protein [Streptomyces sp. DSM 40473]MDT0451114.1 DUF397 domain-containing protein [Streptomyces sp. DSM 40473]